MKKLLYIALFSVLLASCSLDDDSNSQDYYFEILPIEEVIMPDSFIAGNFYTIEYSYKRPTTCYFFNELYYLPEGDFRTVAVINTVFEETNDLVCETLEDDIQWQTFTFECTKNFGTYVFQFWQGQDENGEDTYLVIEVPVE